MPYSGFSAHARSVGERYGYDLAHGGRSSGDVTYVAGRRGWLCGWSGPCQSRKVLVFLEKAREFVTVDDWAAVRPKSEEKRG